MIFIQKLLAVSINFLFAIGLYSQTTDTERPHPPGIFAYQFEKIKRTDSSHLFFLMSPFKLGASPDSTNFIVPKPLILDENGFIAWYYPHVKGKLNSDFKYFESTHQFGWMNFTEGGKANYILLSRDFEIKDTLKNTADILSDAHEFQMLEDGHFLIGGKSIKSYDTLNHVFTLNSPDEKTVFKAIGYVIQEFNEKKELVFQWDSNEFISPDDFIPEYKFNTKEFDYCHGNAIAKDKEGNYLVSFRNYDAIFKINGKTGKVIWKLGGKSNQFTFVNDAGFSGQHNIRLLKNGNITLFDNETNAKEPKISRGVEYHIDTLAMTATMIKEFQFGVYGNSMGSYDPSVNGYHLLNYGFLFNPFPNLTLANEKKEIISQIILEDSVMNYRAELADIQALILRPQVKFQKRKGSVKLIAPDNCSSYLWSTGETSRSIVVRKSGVFQVWTPFGIGMAGSLPLKVEL